MTKVSSAISAVSAVPVALIRRPSSPPVILTSTSDYALEGMTMSGGYAGPSLGLVTIARGLLTAGHDLRKLSLFTEFEGGPALLERDGARIVGALRRQGAAEEGAIIGISTSTSEYAKFPTVARFFRQAFPDALLIAGGSHFVRERIGGFADPIETALSQGLVDAVQQEHAGGFVDLVVRHGGRLEEADAPGLYRRDPSTGNILGSGRGEYPRVDTVPMVHDPDMRSLHLLLRDGCSHRCSFCAVSSRRSPGFSANEALKVLWSALVESDAAHIELRDSNPFLPSRREFYRNVLKPLNAMHFTRKSVYLDPAVLADEIDETLITAAEGAFWYFFAGRDAVLESAARAVGANYRGENKDQGRLDREKKALILFIQFMKQLHALYDASMPPMDLTISFLISPFETREHAKAILEEMREFHSHSDDAMQIHFSLPPLMPFPGTELRNMYSESIDMEDFSFYRVYPDRIAPWKAGAAPSLAFHRAMLGLGRSAGPREMIADFERAIESHLR